MSGQSIPFLLVPAFNNNCARPGLMAKGLVSSILRSLSTAQSSVFHNHEAPLFKVERRAAVETFVPIVVAENSELAQRRATRDFLIGICDYVAAHHRQWVILAHAGSLALRNIDHLIPSDSNGPYSTPEVDFYWARSGKDDISNNSATPGLWAVRGEHLPLVLERLKEQWSKESGTERVDEEKTWTRVVQELPLRKRAFEKGEVVAPRIGAVDWEAVSNAAFVTVPDWPEKEAWKFLQALYFGTYLGDDTGMMLNILEA